MTVPHSLYVTAYPHVCSHAFDVYVSAMSDLINGVIIITVEYSIHQWNRVYINGI